MSKCIDFIGQEVELGDWCTVTQNNTLYVGKVIRIKGSVTIARTSIDEYMLTDKFYLNVVGWQAKKAHVENKFGGKISYWRDNPGWIRNGKFVKITPTQKMLIDYDIKT